MAKHKSGELRCPATALICSVSPFLDNGRFSDEFLARLYESTGRAIAVASALASALVSASDCSNVKVFG